MHANISPVILAGGSGSRLWPLSREGYPKQLLCLNGSKTMFQDTVARLDGLQQKSSTIPFKVNPPLVVCNEEHRFLIAEQLRAAERSAQRLLLEPIGRNTAPALTIAAHSVMAGSDDPVMLVMAADHIIRDEARFHTAVLMGLELALNGHIVTFGIVPDRPETGYGYIQKGSRLKGHDRACALKAFVEKPDTKTAQDYLESGQYLWNSGMFMVRASIWLAAIKACQPGIAKACLQADVGGSEDGDFFRVDRDEFSACPSDSIDYAVMEKLPVKAGKVRISAAVVPLDAGWSDVGAWPAVLELGETDKAGNVAHGDVHVEGASNSLLISESRFLAAVGVKDIIAVETADAVLVVHKDHCQDVRKVVDWLKKEGRKEGRSHRKVYRPWGAYEQLDAGSRHQVKRLSVKPGAVLSLQLHHHRAEHWVVVRGTARVTRGEETFLLTENQSTYIPLGVKHRLENPGRVSLEVIEVQSGSYLREDDIVRFEDLYHREQD